MKESARKGVGIQKRGNKFKPNKYDEQIERLSKQQKLIKVQVNYNANTNYDIRELKNSRNKILHGIKKRLKNKGREY